MVGAEVLAGLLIASGALLIARGLRLVRGLRASVIVVAVALAGSFVPLLGGVSASRMVLSESPSFSVSTAFYLAYYLSRRAFGLSWDWGRVVLGLAVIVLAASAYLVLFWWTPIYGLPEAGVLGYLTDGFAMLISIGVVIDYCLNKKKANALS